MANLACGGPEDLDDLVATTSDNDAVVRYWSAIGIGNLAKQTPAVNESIAKLIKDEAPCVRIAAARALIKLGLTEETALSVLKSELTSEHQWARLRAAIVLGEAGEVARPLIPEMKACLEGQPNKYITRVANRTLNVLLGSNNQVR